MTKKLIKLILAYTILLISQGTLAYNSNNKLVDTFDTLTIFDDETSEQVGEWKLTSFPYIDGVSQI